MLRTHSSSHYSTLYHPHTHTHTQIHWLYTVSDLYTITNNECNTVMQDSSRWEWNISLSWEFSPAHGLFVLSTNSISLILAQKNIKLTNICEKKNENYVNCAKDRSIEYIEWLSRFVCKHQIICVLWCMHSILWNCEYVYWFSSSYDIVKYVIANIINMTLLCEKYTIP